MSTLTRLYMGNVYAYCNGGTTDGSLPPSELTNGPSGKSRGCVVVAKKETMITAIAVHNRHTADAELFIAQTPGGVFYDSAQAGLNLHHARTPDAGVTIPAGQSYDVIVGKYFSLRGTEGLIFLTNIGFVGISALVVDVIGETN